MSNGKGGQIISSECKPLTLASSQRLNFKTPEEDYVTLGEHYEILINQSTYN